MHLNAVYNSNITVLPKSEIEDLTTISLPFNENLQKYELEKICNLVDKHAIRN